MCDWKAIASQRARPKAMYTCESVRLHNQIVDSHTVRCGAVIIKGWQTRRAAKERMWVRQASRQACSGGTKQAAVNTREKNLLTLAVAWKWRRRRSIKWNCCRRRRCRDVFCVAVRRAFVVIVVAAAAAATLTIRWMCLFFISFHFVAHRKPVTIYSRFVQCTNLIKLYIYDNCTTEKHWSHKILLLHAQTHESQASVLLMFLLLLFCFIQKKIWFNLALMAMFSVYLFWEQGSSSNGITFCSFFLGLLSVDTLIVCLGSHWLSLKIQRHFDEIKKNSQKHRDFTVSEQIRK